MWLTLDRVHWSDFVHVMCTWIRTLLTPLLSIISLMLWCWCCHLFLQRRKNNAVTVLEDILSWAEVEILALLKSRKMMKKGRRLLSQNDMTLCTEATPGHSTDSTADYDTMTMGMTLLGVTGSESLSDTLVAQKRSAAVAQLGSLKAFAVDIIQVTCYVYNTTPTCCHAWTMATARWEGPLPATRVVTGPCN